VYAPDLPGAGESDPAPGVPPQEAAANAILDFVDSMRIRQFDLLARGAAGQVALKLLNEREPAVRRVVMLGTEGVGGGPKIVLLSAGDAADPQLSSRLVDLLGAGP
jgi:pimeloyl-ACP methyl ester carboxylesterase